MKKTGALRQHAHPLLRKTVSTQSVLRELLHRARLFSCPDILDKHCPVIPEPGVYAWYFQRVPKGVPVQGCHTIGKHTLLYVGISPCRPPKAVSARPQSLRKRVRYHARGNAEGSTLRLSLGCLLSRELGIELRRVGSGGRMTFTNGERKLSAWMAENAFVTWTKVQAPWEVERALISATCLPLNIAHNTHPFAARLSTIRCTAKARARALPIWRKRS